MIKDNIALAQRILPLIDLTSLGEHDTDDMIKALCRQAHPSVGNVAAVCLYDRFVPLAKTLLQNTPIKVATVCNFPSGNNALERVLQEIAQVCAANADEIDVVMPYQKYLTGEKKAVVDFVAACKKVCGAKTLKIILETGALMDANIIAQASEDVILAGADFIKTSTGKITRGASLEAARAMLQVIARLSLKRIVGFKASGGIRTLVQAAEYLQLADEIMGPKWATPSTFRFGASALLNDILNTLTKA